MRGNSCRAYSDETTRAPASACPGRDPRPRRDYARTTSPAERGFPHAEAPRSRIGTTWFHSQCRCVASQRWALSLEWPPTTAVFLWLPPSGGRSTAKPTGSYPDGAEIFPRPRRAVLGERRNKRATGGHIPHELQFRCEEKTLCPGLQFYSARRQC